MYGNKFIPVNQKACIPYCQKQPKLTTIIVARVKNMTHWTVFGKFCMIMEKWIMASRKKI